MKRVNVFVSSANAWVTCRYYMGYVEITMDSQPF